MFEKLQPKTKIEIANSVDEICRVTQVNPEEFNKEKHFSLAQYLINNIDSLLDSTPELSYDNKEEGEIVNSNRKIERIGHYIVIKYKLGLFKKHRLCFQQFLINERDPDFIGTTIDYSKNTKNIISIKTYNYLTYHFNLLSTGFTFSLYNIKNKWEK